MKFRNVALVSLLGICLVFSGCSASQFEQYLNAIGPAVSIILQIVQVAGGPAVNKSLIAKIDSDTQDLEKLYSDYQSVSAGSKATVRGEIQNAFVLLNQDLNVVFQVAQVGNPNTQKKIAMEIGLVEAGVQLAESLIPSTSAAQSARTELKAKDLVKSFNGVLHAKTGDPAVDKATSKMELHRHSKAVRMASLGLLK